MKLNYFDLKTRTCYLSGETCAEQTVVLSKFLLKLKGDDPVVLMINSPGGDQYEGFAMYDLVRAASNKLPITAIGIGQVASAAVLPFLACDTRIASDHCCFMIHQGTAGIGDNVPSREARRFAKEILTVDGWYEKRISERTSQPLKKIQSMLVDGHYFNSKEAQTLGFVTTKKK